MRKKVFIVVLASLVLGFLTTACVDPETTYNETLGYPPGVEMCQVHITFYQNYYEEDGYIWDKVRIKNGQANTARVQMTFDGTDMEAFDRSVSGQHDAEYKVWIPEYTDVYIDVEYKNSNSDWVGCPDNPMRIGL